MADKPVQPATSEDERAVAPLSELATTPALLVILGLVIGIAAIFFDTRVGLAFLAMALTGSTMYQTFRLKTLLADERQRHEERLATDHRLNAETLAEQRRQHEMFLAKERAKHETRLADLQSDVADRLQRASNRLHLEREWTGKMLEEARQSAQLIQQLLHMGPDRIGPDDFSVWFRAMSASSAAWHLHCPDIAFLLGSVARGSVNHVRLGVDNDAVKLAAHAMVVLRAVVQVGSRAVDDRLLPVFAATRASNPTKDPDPMVLDRAIFDLAELTYKAQHTSLS